MHFNEFSVNFVKCLCNKLALVITAIVSHFSFIFFLEFKKTKHMHLVMLRRNHKVQRCQSGRFSCGGKLKEAALPRLKVLPKWREHESKNDG